MPVTKKVIHMELAIVPIDPTRDGPRVKWLRELCGWSAESVDLWMTLHPHDRITYLAYIPDDPEPVGMGALKLHDDQYGQPHMACKALGIAESAAIYVRPEYRGKGYGKRIVTFIDEEAKRLGLKMVCMNTSAVFEHSIAIYRSLGYKVYMYGNRPYLGTPYYCVFMQKRLMGV
jgi:GNAT superfamily N-acetyltransferase